MKERVEEGGGEKGWGLLNVQAAGFGVFCFLLLFFFCFFFLLFCWLLNIPATC